MKHVLIAALITYVVDSLGKVRWAYISASASDRHSRLGLARAALAVAGRQTTPSNYPGKT
ncbi:MAG TPA: hypothetical protein VLJ79_25495 [Candidatus Binatia bacterium]|nr:hypothetical protein [Candidatus Binatia bacterium]